MTVGILPGPEAVYPFDYVESAQSCFTSCNALALDDGVRAMVPGALADRYQPALSGLESCNCEDIGCTARLDVYGSVTKSTAPAHELRDHAMVTPYTLSCTT